MSSAMSVLFYWGVMQYIISKIAWVMQITMATTAAESVSAAANIFIGTVCDVCGLVIPASSDVTRNLGEWGL